jgi:hypothetical protein
VRPMARTAVITFCTLTNHPEAAAGGCR